MPVDVFEVVAEPQRRRILDRLASGERAVNELVDHLALSQPAVSKHLRVLRDAELVTVRIDGPRRLYRLRPEPLRALDDWLAPFRSQWGERLDDLGRHLETMAADDRRPRKGAS